MLNDDELEPVRSGRGGPSLEAMSVDELDAYIQRLEEEKGRAQAEREARQANKGAAQALFRI